MEDEDVQVNVRITRSQHVALKILLAKRGGTMRDILGRLIDKYLAYEDRKAKEQG